MLDSKTRAKLRSQAQSLHATLEVGKGGVTEPLVKELVEQLERRSLVKVGLRASATHDAGRKAVAEDIAAKTGADLVEVRGNTAVYYRR